jgi:WD40 repeat protein
MVGALAALALAGTAMAGGGYAHNYPDVKWNTLETEHFLFHWPESELAKDDPHYFTTEWTTGRLAEIAEVSYPKICGQLEYFPTEKLHVVIYDQDNGWEGNGFAVAELDWTGFAARWGPTFRMRGRMEFLSDVFVHEFAHIVSLKAFSPWSEGSTWLDVGGLSEDEEWLRRWGHSPSPGVNFDIGADVIVSTHAPFWWAEGGAEYWSHQAGYNSWGTSRDAFLRMTVLEDRVLDPVEWTTRIDKAGFDGERGYNQGYSFGLWLRDHTGKDAYSEMARVGGERWHYDWDTVVKEVTNESTEDLHAQWSAYLDEFYTEQVAAARVRGIVTGGELALTKPPWEDPTDDDWKKLTKPERETAMDGTGAYQELPSVSPDGKTMAWFQHGLNIVELGPEDWGAISGEYLDPEDKADKKKLAKIEKRWAVYDFMDWYRVSWSPDGQRILATGTEDLSAEWAMNAGLTWNGDGYNWDQLVIGTIDRSGKKLKVDWKPIPNTMRATETAWSGDGETVAFARYGDGTHELWTIRPDGSEAKQRTHFGDGTQVQGISFTPDNNKLLISLFRNFQQDLWLLDLRTDTLERLTDTRADETDPMIGPDGRAWFTSDVDGIFNVYSLDTETHKVLRHTELLGGAYGAWAAPGGHVFYTGITGHGFRIFGLAKDAMTMQPFAYPGLCGLDPEACTDTTETLAFDDARRVDAASDSRKYSWGDGVMPLSAWPVARAGDRNVQVGAGFYFGDTVETQGVDGEVAFGKDNSIWASWTYMKLWPDIQLGAARSTYKGTYGYALDEDGLAATEGDRTIVDLKFEQASDDVWLYVTYMPSYSLWGGIGGDISRYSFRDTGDGAVFTPYTEHAGVGVFVEWSPTGGYFAGDQWINPRGGRRLYIDAQHRWTRIVDPELGGEVIDDGQAFDAYGYNQISASYTEWIPMRWFGLFDHHTLQLDLEAGYIDRNVMGWDELLAGGRHPYYWGSGTIGNNVQFSGYEGYSLSGETMLISNLAYRFPLARDLDWKIGPTYTESLYLQVFGSVGNLWSYRVEGDTHVEGYSVVANDPDSVRREVPFSDYAHKNSPAGEENYLLSDIGVELRIRSFIWNDWDWDSFMRVSYGLKATAGYGDVNADLVQSSVARDANSELSDEVEPPTIRIYAGLGTGW